MSVPAFPRPCPISAPCPLRPRCPWRGHCKLTANRLRMQSEPAAIPTGLPRRHAKNRVTPLKKMAGFLAIFFKAQYRVSGICARNDKQGDCRRHGDVHFANRRPGKAGAERGVWLPGHNKCGRPRGTARTINSNYPAIDSYFLRRTNAPPAVMMLTRAARPSRPTAGTSGLPTVHQPPPAAGT